MENQKIISIIIPSYSYAHYLSECVESVINQSERAHEIVIVSDGAVDNTVDIAKELIKKYPYQNIILIEKENGGLSSARNTGIREATSEYILCLDADDMLRPDAIKEHLKIAGENVIAQCGLMYFGNQVAEFRPQGATLESMLKANTVYCDSVFTKKMWEAVGGYDESETMRLGLEDWMYFIELMANGAKVVTSDYIALLYRRHGNTMTHTTTHPKWNEIIDFMAKKVYNKYGLIADFHKI